MAKKKRTLHPTAFRLTPLDFLVLDHIRESVGVTTRSAALRYALRWYKRERLV